MEKNVWPGWETVGLIGRGSFGAVYEIQRTIFDDVEKAALKVISIPQNASDIDELYSDGYDDESITSTFQSHLKSIVAEYSLMRKMNGSANIVNCDDVRYVQHDDGIGWDIFIKMELLTPLTRALPAVVPEEAVVRIAKDMCVALELCKKFDIVHRDIKPQNIFVSDNGDYKLGDFGIAKTVERTMGGTKIGTYKYMAPEVYNNQPYGSSADIYSLGLVLYWLLNERRMPFLPLPPEKLKVGMDEEARNRRLSGAAIPPPVHGGEGLKQIVLKACAYDPARRYATATQMLEELKEYEMSMPYSGSRSGVSVDKSEEVVLLQNDEPRPLSADVVQKAEEFGAAAVACERNDAEVSGVLAQDQISDEKLSAVDVEINADAGRIDDERGNRGEETSDACASLAQVVTPEEETTTEESVDGGNAEDEVNQDSGTPLSSGESADFGKKGTKARKKGLVLIVAFAGIVSLVICFLAFGGRMTAGNSNVAGDVSLSQSEPEEAKTFLMPYVINKPEQEAKKKLEELGVAVTISKEYNNEVESGMVIRSSVNAGITTTEGDSVIIYVSQGPEPVQVNPLAINRKSLKLTVGSRGTLKASGGDGTYTWKVNNTKVAKVSDGTVTAVGEGKTTITVISGEMTAKCIVTVTAKTENTKPQESKPQESTPKRNEPEIGLSDSKVTVRVGGDFLVGVQSIPTANFITWSSSDDSVATVNSTGRITGISAGKATITVKLTFGKDAYTRKCAVTVIPK